MLRKRLQQRHRRQRQPHGTAHHLEVLITQQHGQWDVPRRVASIGQRHRTGGHREHRPDLTGEPECWASRHRIGVIMVSDAVVIRFFSCVVVVGITDHGKSPR